jgi:hypothetical protein
MKLQAMAAETPFVPLITALRASRAGPCKESKRHLTLDWHKWQTNVTQDLLCPPDKGYKKPRGLNSKEKCILKVPSGFTEKRNYSSFFSLVWFLASPLVLNFFKKQVINFQHALLTILYLRRKQNQVGKLFLCTELQPKSKRCS